MGKADETENSGDSDTTEGETTKEGDETEENSGNSDTPVIDDPAGNGSEDDQDVTPEQPVENPVASEGEVSDEELNTVDGEEGIMPLDANQTVTVSVGSDSATFETDSGDNTKIIATATGATVTFNGGVEISGGSATTTTDDLAFTVDAKKGYQLEQVTYTIGSGESEPVDVTADKQSASATITAGDISGNVAIVVTVKKLHTVTFNVAKGASVEVQDAEGNFTAITTENNTVTIPDGETITFNATVSDTDLYSVVEVKVDGTPLEAGSENTYTTSPITADTTIEITPVDKWSKVTMAVAVDSDADATVTFGDSVHATTKKAEAGKDITFKVEIADGVDKLIDKVEVTNAENETITATSSADKVTWTIDKAVFAQLATETTYTVKVILKEKEYTVTLPYEAFGITWEYQEKGAGSWTATTVGQELKITSTKTIVLRASVENSSEKKYSVTVAALSEDAKTVNKTTPATWEFTTEDFGADGTLDLSGATAVELVDITVTGSTAEAPFSVKYFMLEGDKTEEDALKENAVYTAAAENKIANVPVGTNVYLQITATGAAEGREVASAGNATAKYGEIGTVYLVTASATADDNTVAVTLDTAAAKKVNVTKDEHVATVKYAPGEETATRPMPASGKINLPSSATKISINVAAAANYEIAYVHKTKGAAHKDTDCEACVGGTDGRYTIDLAEGDAATEIEIATRKTMVEYSLAAAAGSALADINVTVEKADASGADPVSVSGNDLTVGYKLGSGDTYYISADKKDANNALIKDVTISSGISGFKPVSGTNKYRFTADKAHTGDALTFTFTVNKKANKTVDFVTTNADLAAAPIKTGAYTKLNAGGTATEEVAAAADFAALASPYSVYEGTGFKFQLKAAENYRIKAVTCQVGTGAATTLDKGEDEFYTLASVTDNTKITVTTEVDPASAFGIKINENPYVASATIDWTGAATPGTTLELGTAALNLTAGTDNKVNFSVTAKTGYTIDKVLDGTEEISAVQGQTYYQVALTKGQTKGITVQTKAATNNTDKFVKLIPYGYGNAVPDVDVTAPSGIEPVKTESDGSRIYKLTGAKTENGTTTPGIDEITVVATVEAGYTLDADTVVSAGAILDSQKDGAYTFKISAGATTLASATTEENAAEFTFIASKDMVTLKTVAGSNGLASVKKYATVGGYGRIINVTTSGTQVDPGSMIVVTVNPGDKLLVNGEAVELKDNSWSEVVELGGGSKEDPDTYTFKAVKKEDYKVQYVIKHGETESSPKTVDGSDIDVKYGDQVELSLLNADATAQIIKANVTSEGETASTAQLKKDAGKTKAAIIDVKDAGSAFNVVLTVENDGEEYATTELAPITFQTKTTVTDVTVKGISKGKENKLDATSRMTYPLTVKAGRTVLNAADYADMLTVASADTNVATAAIVGGNLVIETKTTGSAVVTIKAVNQSGDDNLFSFTVTGQDPKKKLAVKSLASSAQGMNDLYLDMTPNTAIKEVSGAFDYYYEVNVAWKKGNDETAADHNTGYYYYLADVDDNKLQALTERIVVNKINAETNGDKCGNTYTFSTKMIAVKAGTTPANGQKAYELKDGEFASEKATVKDFSTRNKYYEDKLGVTKKTTKITSGQEEVLVAVPKFSAKASHIDDVYTKVCNTDGSEYTAYGNSDYITAYWDETTNEIRMTAGQYTPAGKYNLVIEATAHQTDGGIYDMYRATATVPITVVGGVSRIDVTYPAQIAQTGSRDVSITLKAIGYARMATSEYRSSSYKAASQKFTYELGSVANAKNKDQVIVKGSKVTVKKGFTVSADPENNKFTVNAVAGDPVGYFESVTIEVTNEALVPTEIYLTKDGKKLGNNLTTLEANEADVVVKAGNRVINSSLLTITPAYNGKKTGVSGDTLFVKGKGTLALKATTTDGGKKSVTKKDKYNITYPTNVTYSMYAENSNGVRFYEKGGKYQYSDTGNGVLGCYILADVPGMWSEDNAYTDYFSYSVSVKGGKIVDKDVADGYYAILPNARETVVTVTDKANKNKKTLFTFVNLNYVDKKAPAATTKDKLYLAYDSYDEEYHCASMSAQTLRFTLKDNKDGYNAVKFTPADIKSYRIVDIEGTYTIDKDNEFVVDPIYPDAVGTAKYNVVYGTSKNGTFYPATKAATLSVKVNKLGNMKPTAKYTINTVESLSTPLTYKPVDGVMYFDRVVSANVGGKKNKFFEFFELDDTNTKLRIKTAQYEKLTAALKADPKNGNADFNPKEDLTGYLEYHYYTVNGRVDKSDKITVTVKTDQKVKYVASPVNVLAVSGVEATTSITLGKSPVMIASAKNVTDGWTATAVKAADGAYTNQVKLTCTGTPEKGKVEFYVIPADSPKNASTAYETDGILVSANVTVLKDDSSAKVKVDTKKNLTHTAAIPAANDKVVFTAEAVQGEAFSLVAGGYAISKAEKVAVGADATEAQKSLDAAVTKVEMKTAAEVPTIGIELDGKNAMAVAAKGIITVPVKLTFDKGTVKEEIISLKVKLQDKPDVSKAVKDLLDNHELTDTQISTRANAKAAMEAYAAANKDEIDPMCGVVIQTIEAKAATEDAWGEGTGKSYEMEVTLKDLYAAADAEAVKVSIVVKKKAAEVTVEDAASAAANKIVITKSTDSAVAATEFLLTEATTKDQIADWIETAVKDKATYEDMKYVVVDIEGWAVEPATEQSTGSFYCSYAVVNSMTDVELATGTIRKTFPQKTSAASGN